MALNEQITFLERLVNLVEKHGLLRIFKAILVLMAFFFVMYNGLNINTIVESVIKKQEIEHGEALEYRRKISPKIELCLSQLLLNTGADRAFILEMHNGTSNVSGLPFYYGEMTYERVTNRTYHIDEDYRNLNLSRFPFIYYLDEHNSWHGSIEELSLIDNKMSMRLKSNDVTYSFFECLHGMETPIGFIGLTFCNDNYPNEKNMQNIIKLLNIASKQVSGELDMKKIKMNDYE